ncbi:MAG: phage tail assembly chaperone [Rhodobacteraceae bacterium]|nr:phage tail assembly chaperone [Paracoccaceae bacterium]
MSGIAWGALMQAGLHGLRLRPADFWALTPHELMLMLGTADQSRPLSRARLDALMRTFPDHDHTGEPCAD